MYIGAPIYRSNRRRSGSLLPRASVILRGDRGLVTDGAVDFVAADQSYLSATGPDNNFDLANNDWWLSFWYYSRPSGLNQTIMRRRQGGTTTNGGWAFSVDINELFAFTTRANDLPSTTTIPTTRNQWHFVCLTFKKDTQTLYLRYDDELRTIENAEPATPNDAWFIGSLNSISPSFNGLVDSQFMGYADSIPMSESAISGFLYNSGKGRIGIDLETDPIFSAQAGVAHIWDYNEESGQRKDRKGSLHFNEQFLPIISPALNNGGFETPGTAPNLFAGWTDEDASSSSDAYAGVAACELPNLDSRISRNAILTSAKRYSISCYAKGTGELTLGTNATDATRQHKQVTSANYAQVNTILRGGSNLFFENSSGDNTVIVDNVNVTATEMLSAKGIAAGWPQNGDPVVSLSDETTGNQIALEQPLIPSQPHYKSNALDSIGSVSSDGFDDYYALQDEALPAGSKTIIVVFKATNTGDVLSWSYNAANAGAGSLKRNSFSFNDSTGNQVTLTHTYNVNEFRCVVLSLKDYSYARQYVNAKLENNHATNVPAWLGEDAGLFARFPQLNNYAAADLVYFEAMPFAIEDYPNGLSMLNSQLKALFPSIDWQA